MVFRTNTHRRQVDSLQPKTSALSLAKLRLGDLEKKEPQVGRASNAATDARISFGDALAVYEQRLKGHSALKHRTWDYHEQRINALFKQTFKNSC